MKTEKNRQISMFDRWAQDEPPEAVSPPERSDFGDLPNGILLKQGDFVIDHDHEEPIYSSVCAFCRHLDQRKHRTCPAFPERIPDAIWLGENNHQQAISGDNGVRFERRAIEPKSR